MTDIRAALAQGERWSGDVTLRAATQQTVLHAQAFPLHHPETDARLGTAWLGQDITDLRASEAALRAANSDLMQFRALVEASGDFIAIAGLDGAVRYVNPAGRELIGLDPDVDTSTTTIVDYLTPQGIEASLQVEQPAVLAHGHWEGVSTLRNHRGAPIPVEIASFLMRDPETDEPFALATVQRDITERLAVEADLRRMSEQREALLDRLVEAQEAERAQIAADVHDDSIQVLAAVDLRLGLLKRRLGERAPEMEDVLAPLQESVSNAIDRLRALLFDLEPPDLEEGLAAALRRAGAQIFEDTPTRFRVVDEHEPDAPVATRAVAYRIAREAMVNAHKHADASTVTVTVAGTDGGLAVSVTDDGAGLPKVTQNVPQASPPGHHGLSSMRDRAAVAGGRLEISPGPTGGTTVHVWLPTSSVST
jgi:PAS domain S-box-containing protein